MIGVPRHSVAQHNDVVRHNGVITTSYFQVDVPKGGERVGHVELEFCLGCGKLVRAACQHEVNKWEPGADADADADDEQSGQKLICQLCGMDVS